MNTDLIVQLLRYAVLAIGGLIVGAGLASKEQLASFSNMIPEVVSTISMIGAAVWGLYVKWNTQSVPTAIADRPSVPVVSGVTGQIKKE